MIGHLAELQQFRDGDQRFGPYAIGDDRSADQPSEPQIEDDFLRGGIAGRTGIDEAVAAPGEAGVVGAMSQGRGCDRVRPVIPPQRSHRDPE